MPICLECEVNLPRLQWTHFKFKCSGKFNNGKEYLEKYPNAKLVDDALAKKTAITLTNFISKYGQVDGTKKFDEYRHKQAFSNTFEYKKQKYGWTKTDYNNYNKSRSSTLKNFIDRYGEEIGYFKWQNYCERQRHTCSLDYFTEKWGIDHGSRRYNNWMKKWISNQTSEKQLFKKLKTILNEKISTQVRLGEKTDKRFGYFYDFGSKKRKKLIEFNGTFWHADPRVYPADELLPKLKKTAKELWRQDQEKISYAIQSGYKVYVIWEKDWKTNENDILQEIKLWWFEK